VEVIERIIICDAGPIIHLDELDCLDILDFRSILIPETVYREIQKYRDISFSKYPNIQIIDDPSIPTRILKASKIYDLQKGEIMAISLALENENSILLTDDSTARLFADNLKIVVHGTIGLLVRAVRRNIKSSQTIINVLTNLKTKSTLHITKKLIDEAINSIRKKSD
jgi:predicted nucleic acid-binding protein